MSAVTPQTSLPALDPSSLRTADFDYDLPADLIAQEPLAERDASRLLVLDRAADRPVHARVRDLPRLLRAGDLLVVNDSRVLPARLHARKAGSGGKVEILLLRRSEAGLWRALARPTRRLRAGTALLLRDREDGGEATAVVEAVWDEGEIDVRLPEQVERTLERWGDVPLPPYIHHRLDDPERYQTIYAEQPGSAAAPTAGLHFTPRLIAELDAAGIGWASVTLHVGLDTFRPVTSERLIDHHIHQEWCEVSDETAARIAATRAAGGRVIAVGTTSARTLETVGRQWDDRYPRGYHGLTEIYILPGYQWRLVDGLLTNFHLPRSTLLAMVSALAGWERIRAAYAEAIAQRYRFYSFGDAMLII